MSNGEISIWELREIIDWYGRQLYRMRTQVTRYTEWHKQLYTKILHDRRAELNAKMRVLKQEQQSDR